MLGFIGAGNMATAIIKGVISSNFLPANEIVIYDISSNRCNELSKELGVNIAESASDVVTQSSQIVLAVKPNVLAAVLDDLKEFADNKLFISIAAGKSLAFIEEHLGKAKIVRVMPNINAVVGEAISAFCANDKVEDDDKAFAEKLLCSFGEAVELAEDKFSIYSAIGGCSPAYAYMFIDSMARAAVKNGMTKADALKVSAQAVLGSAKMILESGEHPWSLVDKVCSPGGTTIEGVAALEENAFQSTVTKAIEAAYNKDKRL